MKNRVTQSEIGKGWMSRAAIAMSGGDRMRVLARFRSVSAVAILAAASGACGGDDSSAPSDPGSPEIPSAPTNMTPPANDPAPVTPAESPTPSTPPGAAAESPPGSVPLENPPPANENGGGAAGGEEPPTPEGEEPPVPEGEGEGEVTPPEPTPEPPVAFNPCPTDGSPCRIMPLGDSITDGLVGNGPGNTTGSVGGYRVELFRRAVTDGHAITFVGRQQNGPTADIAGQPFPRNHEGYSGATISSGGNQIASRLDAALAAAPADIILLHIGTNDMIQAAGAAAAPGNLENLLDQITDGAPDALVVVAQIIPLGFGGNAVPTYNAAITGIVQERVDAGKHLILVDQFTPIASAPNFVAELVGDSVHPNAAGYAAMAETWYEAIETFLP